MRMAGAASLRGPLNLPSLHLSGLTTLTGGRGRFSEPPLSEELVVAAVTFLVSKPACVFAFHVETQQMSHLQHREVKELVQGIAVISQHARPSHFLLQSQNSF